MPSPTDFNVSPYYDDFSEDKKFHRVLYRPGFAVQARELTSQQSILQGQIEKMGEHLFEQGAMVIPGNVTLDIHYEAVKLTSFTGTLTNFVGTTVTGSTSGVKGKVVKVEATDGTDPDTLFVKYRDSGSSNEGNIFTDGETLTSSASTGETAIVNTTATGSSAHITAGTYFINGFFVEVSEQTIVLDKYTNTPSYRVGLTITENFITSTDDSTLLDNASGSSNENATGAHRFKIDLTLAKLSLTSTADSSFVELARIRNGVIEEKATSTRYNILEDTLARRTFDESGDYAVRAFDLDIREHLLSGTNRGINAAGATSADGNTADEAKLSLGLSQGKAYVKGYEIEKHGTTFIDLDKAREFETQSGSITRFEQLPFVNITELSNLPDVGFVSGETEVYKTLRLVDEEHSSRGTVLTSAGGTNFDIGRAKSRAIEFNSGTASTVFLSNSSVTTNTFKHYLFDIEMFAHINTVGAASGSFTNGEIITGGTSGATGIFQSVSTQESSTITGATSANPVVVTCSGGHKLKEGQQVTISGVSGITDINGTHTVKDPTATTFKLFAPSSATVGDASGTQPATVDGSGFSSYSGSGGLAKHDVVILSNIKGEFTDGETITGASSSVTATVQHSAYNQKGFIQKKFPQVKGISMAGSPVFTSDVDLTSTFGDQKTLTGTVTIANSATSLKGFGTRFQTELVIGDVIEFTDDANTTVTKVVESIESNTLLELSSAVGGSDVTTKASFIRKRTKMQEPTVDRAIFKMPYEVVKTLLTTDNSSLSDTSFKIRRQFVTTLSSSGTATLTAGTNEVFTAHSDTDFLASIMSTGSGGTGAVGDVLTLGSSGDYTLGGSPTGKTVALDLGSGFNGHKIKVTATLSTSVVSAKTKTANTAETTTVNTSALATADFISLGKADVYSVDSVHMAADFSTAATTSDTDITNRFDLDTGQRDNFYDIARLVRKPGTQAPTGRLLITFNFFSHGAGNFFSVDSYSGFDYGSIPTYTSDVTGKKFNLRDSLDFRPRVDDASTIDSGQVDRSFDGTGASTVDVMKINSDVTADLEYYLARRDKIFITADGDFKAIKGASSLDPIDPEGIDDAMLLYKLFTPAYTFNTSDVEITPLDNRRFTMRDIGRLEKRLENVEYYTQLSLLESEAQNMQIQDSDGFDRFKNGIIVDNFTGHGVGDVSDNDYSISMDMAEGELRPAFHQDNAALVEVDSTLSETVTDAERSALGYQKTGDLITLPYTESTFQEQPFASNTVNLQPFNVIDFIGTIKLDPEIDEWFETERQPDLQITMPGTFDTLTNLASAGVLDLNLGTVWNNWNDTWSGQVRETNRQVRRTGNIQQTTITTEQRVGQRRSGVRTSLIPNAVRTSFGDRVVSVAFAPFIRSRSVSFTGQDLKPNTRMYPFFDGVDVSAHVTPTGSSAGAALTTDSKGECSGVFLIPDPLDNSNPRFRTGKRVFRLTTSSTNSLVNEIFSSAEADYTAKGLLNSVQQTIVSTREAQVQREDLQENTTITRTDRRVESQVLQQRSTHRHNRNPDPVAQSFIVNSKDGLFVSSIEAFFSTKDSSQPVQCQIRTMVNGYPTTTILPFGISVVNGSSISTSSDGTTATKFTFPSPVFLKDKTEYCFVLKSNSDEYTIWTARMGSKTVDSSRLISKQPHFGGMFKSQNGGTWTPDQNEDIKFKLNRCEFTTGTNGTVRLANADLPVKSLTKTNPLTTTASSGVVTVNHKNHGMHSTSNNVTIAGLASGSHNGIAHSNINGTYTTIGNIKLDSYTITAQSSDTASASGDIGSTTMTATRNMLFDVIQPVIGNMVPPGTDLTATMRSTTGKTLEGSETEFTLTSAAKAVAVNLNEDYYMTAPGMVASTINSTNEMSGSKSLVFTLTLSSAGTNTALSPVIDTKRISAFLIQNRMFSPASGTTPDFVAETKNTGGSVPAKYITKPVLLKDNATAMDIRISANVRSEADFKVFFRTTAAEDVRKLGDKDFTAFNTDGSPDSAVAPAEDRETFKEFKFTASSLPEFTAFQIKIVLTGTNSSYPPLLKDLRGIALAL